jgi:hypothetical protein
MEEKYTNSVENPKGRYISGDLSNCIRLENQLYEG